MVDFKKAFEAAKLPLFLIILLDFVLALLAALYDIHFPFLSFFVNVLLFAWAGYKATKELKQDLITAGLSGSITALIFGIVAVLYYTFIINTIYTGSLFGDFGALVRGPYVVAIIQIPISIVVNFFIALVGGLIGQKMK